MRNSLHRLHVHAPRRRALDLLIAKRQPDLVRVFDHVKAGSNLLLLRLTLKWARRHAEHSPRHITLTLALAFRLSQASFFLWISQNCLPTKRPVITSKLRFDWRTWTPITIKGWTYWTFWTHTWRCPERVRETNLLHPENEQLPLVYEISQWCCEICF